MVFFTCILCDEFTGILMEILHVMGKTSTKIPKFIHWFGPHHFICDKFGPAKS